MIKLSNSLHSNFNSFGINSMISKELDYSDESLLGEKKNVRDVYHKARSKFKCGMRLQSLSLSLYSNLNFLVLIP